MKRSEGNSTVGRKSPVLRSDLPRVFDAKRRASVMMGKIQALGIELQGHLKDPHGSMTASTTRRSWSGLLNDNLEPPSNVTSCVINVCTTRTLDDKEEGEETAWVDEPIEILPPFYKHELPEGFRFPYMVPRSHKEWLDFVVWLVKQRITFKYLTDMKLKRIIEIARGQIGRVPQAEVDPDIPDCYNWDEEQVGTWLTEIGFPQLQDVFRKNAVNGRKLLAVDASALNRMGIQDFKMIQELALNIRTIFGLTKPNGMRPMLRVPPFETFLTKFRIHNGRTYDLFTFKKFCKQYHYDYEDLIESKNRNAHIPCACSIVIRTQNVGVDDVAAGSSEVSGASSGNSVRDAGSVEFQVRHQFIRNATIERIINELIDLIFQPVHTESGPIPSPDGSGPNLDELVNKILNRALLDLGFGDPKQYTCERMKFAAQIALALLAELRNTADVMSDISRLKAQLRMEPCKDEILDMRVAAGAFMEDLAPIAALLALNQLSLEAIFRHEPEFEQYVNSIVAEAEKLTNDAVPTATALVDSVISEAKARVRELESPYGSIDAILEAKDPGETGVEGLDPTSAGDMPPGSWYDDSGHHLVVPALVEPNEAAWERIFKGKGLKGLKGKPGPKKKAVTSRAQKVGAGGDATLTNQGATVAVLPPSWTSINGAQFWKKMEKMKLSPRLGATGSVSKVEGQRAYVVQTSRPQTAPVVTGSKKKGLLQKSGLQKRTKARDIWNEVKLLRTNVATNYDQEGL